MKKIISLLLIMLLVITVVACSQDKPTTDDPAPPADETPADDPAEEPPAEDPAGDYEAIDTLEVQLIPSRDAAVLDAQRGPLQTKLSEKLGMPVNVTVATDYTGLIEAMKSKKVHVGFWPRLLMS